jgi:UDP-3-O-acyl N-acetylglucosamine deacetylase
MGKALYESFPSAKEVFDEADDALSFHLARAIFEGPEEELRRTAVTQPAIMTVSVASTRVLEREMGVKKLSPLCGAGHSLGEYTALVAAKVLSFRDAVELVHKRGAWMQEAAPEGTGAMAAILGLGIDNLRIDVHGGELPIMDGSAAPFVMLLNGAGIRKQNAARKVLRIAKPINYTLGEKSIYAEPYEGFFVDYTIDFAHPLIGVQNLALEITPQTFSEIAKARTFGFFKEVEYLYSRGLALGGSLDNSVVLDEHGVLNQEGLRFNDEFVRHKLLDFIGDMAMINLPLQGRFTVHCSGHTLNNQFLRVLDENRAIYLEEIVLDVPAYTRRKYKKDGVEERKGNELRDPVPVL